MDLRKGAGIGQGDDFGESNWEKGRSPESVAGRSNDYSENLNSNMDIVAGVPIHGLDLEPDDQHQAASSLVEIKAKLLGGNDADTKDVGAMALNWNQQEADTDTKTSDNVEKPPPLPVGPIGVYNCKEMIHGIFLETGQKELVMQNIRLNGMQHEWTRTMRDKFLDYIKKRGQNNVNVSHMIADLAPLGRELFPNELKKELENAMYDVVKDYFKIDDTVTPLTDPDNPNSEAEKTFLYQSRDVKPEPGLGVGVEVPDSPPPSPQESPRQASGGSASSSAAVGSIN